MQNPLITHIENFLSTNDRVVAWGCGALSFLGVPAFLAAEDVFSKVSVGTAIGVLGVIAGVAGTYWKNKGGMIKARSDADVAAAEVLAKATDKLIQQTNDQYNRQILMLQDDLKVARDRADRERARADEETLICYKEKAGKHTVLEELNALMAYRYLLEDTLRQARIPFPDGPKLNFTRATRQTDDSVEKIVEKRAALSAAVVEKNILKSQTQNIEVAQKS